MPSSREHQGGRARRTVPTRRPGRGDGLCRELRGRGAAARIRGADVPHAPKAPREAAQSAASTAWDADSRPEGVVLSVDKGRGKNTRKGSRETDRSPASKMNHVPSLKYFGKNELSQHAINGERSQGFNH